VSKPAYKRILLKLSGEAFAGESGMGIDASLLKQFAQEVVSVHEAGVQVGLVVGGGNFFRGVAASAQGMDQASADYMGMLGTCINGLALQDALEKLGLQTRVQSAISMFTTDTAAALRAMEINADVIMKATKVDGIYDKDPMKHDDAVLYDEISYIDVLKKGLQVMDSTAISLCMDNKLPIRTFNLTGKGNVLKMINGEKIGTIVS